MDPLILDVRETIDRVSCSPSTADAIIDGLSKPPGARSLPTLLVYNERGLRLYDDLTTKAPEYYLFGCEEQILIDHADDIVATMKATQRVDEVVIELGAGSLRKTSHFLLALARAVDAFGCGQRLKTSYFALDLERSELVRTLQELSSSIGTNLTDRVSFGGMWGTYDGGIAFVKRGGLKDLRLNQHVTSKLGCPGKRDHARISRTAPPSPVSSQYDGDGSSLDDLATVHTHIESPLPTPPSSLPSPSGEESDSIPIHLLFLGSSIGNFTRDGAAEFLRSLPLRAGSGDTLLLGLDHRNDPDLIRLAYDDPQGHTRAFAMNGMVNAEEATRGAIDSSRWSYVGVYNETLGRHEKYYRSNVKQSIQLPASGAHPDGLTVEIQEGELVNFAYSYKYSDQDAFDLFASANLQVVRRWQDKEGRYSLWLLERAVTD